MVHVTQGRSQDFREEGPIGLISQVRKCVACVSMHKLGGLGACSPRNLKFTTSKTVSGGF